jgi:hypothetical protein
MATNQRATLRVENSVSGKKRSKKRHSNRHEQRIGEAGVQTSAGIERGRTYSEIPKTRREMFSSFGSE